MRTRSPPLALTTSPTRRFDSASRSRSDSTAPTAEAGTTFTVVADDWQRWEFEGEYWIDEVPNYRSSLRTECVEQ